MRNIKPEEGSQYGAKYHMVADEKGVLRCSCGSKLVKMDEKTYKCPGGFPIYRVDEGDIVKDKFGNLLFRMKDHGGNDGKKKEKER